MMIDLPSKRSRSFTLLPITPIHEIRPGCMDTSEEQNCVVYLAPLTYTAAEKYFARTKKKNTNRQHSLNHEGREEFQNTQIDSRKQSCNVINDSCENSSHTMPTSRPPQIKQQTNSKKTLIAIPSTPVNISLDSIVSNMGGTDRHCNDQIQRLKAMSRFLPSTEEEQNAFWTMMRNYQSLQLAFHRSMLSDRSSPVGFNFAAAWNNKLREERHTLWVKEHDNRVVATRQRKLEEDAKYEQRMFQASDAYRAQKRMLREVRGRLERQACALLPTIFLVVATQAMLNRLQEHWRRRQLKIRLRGIIHIWSRERIVNYECRNAARLLINWLQKSVTVKSVAFRVFRGIRTFVRRVKRIQRLWRGRVARRELSFRIIEKKWMDQELEELERTKQIDRKAHRKKHKLASNKANTKVSTIVSNGTTMSTTVVPDKIRREVILGFIREKDLDFRQRFRQQEDDLFPHLVEMLHCANPNRSRRYIRVWAEGYALSGRVYSTLIQQFPDTLDDRTKRIDPFDMHNAPINELIKRAQPHQ